MKTGRNYKFWFCTGSQDLYGDECLRKVAEHSRIIVDELNKSGVEANPDHKRTDPQDLQRGKCR